MWKQILVLGLTVAVLTGLPLPLRSEDGSLKTKQWTFDSKDALAGWTVTGDVAFDSTKSREGQQARCDRPRRKGTDQAPGQGRVGQVRALGL